MGCGTSVACRRGVGDRDGGFEAAVHPESWPSDSWKEARVKLAAEGRRLSNVLPSWGSLRRSKSFLVVSAQSNKFGWEGRWRVPEVLFGALGEDCCRAVAAQLQPCKPAHLDTVFREGDSGNSMYFINTGSITVKIGSLEVMSLEPGMYFGEQGLLLNETRTVTVVSCGDDCELLELSKEGFLQVGHDSSSAGDLSISNGGSSRRASVQESGSPFGTSLQNMIMGTNVPKAAMDVVRRSSLVSAAKNIARRYSREDSLSKTAARLKVTNTNARPGQLVSLDLDAMLAAPGPHCRFPGDEGPGQLVEDHFGDGSMWRVRWLLTNAWGIYPTGFDGQQHLLHGAEHARQAWDPDAFAAPGRMPSFFFCAPVPADPADRTAVLAYSSPRSRLLMQR